MPRTALEQEALPRLLEPTLLRAGLPPADQPDRWVPELKWDGMRAQLRTAGEAPGASAHEPAALVATRSRELADLAEALSNRASFLDGELVCLGTDGRPDFHRLRRRLNATSAQAAGSLAIAHPTPPCSLSCSS